MLDRRKICELLGTGLSNDVVATSLGCDPSYITQLMSEEEFRAEVIELRTKSLTADTKRDRVIDNVEDRLLEKISDTIHLVHKPHDLLMAFRVVNAAKRRGVAAHASTVVNNTVVNLMIPKVVQQKLVITSEGEVVDANGQSLVSMTAGSLLDKLKGNKDGAKYAKVAGQLAPAITTGFSE